MLRESFTLRGGYHLPFARRALRSPSSSWIGPEKSRNGAGYAGADWPGEIWRGLASQRWKAQGVLLRVAVGAKLSLSLICPKRRMLKGSLPLNFLNLLEPAKRFELMAY